MDTCVICGKSQEGIVLELEEEDGQIREKHVCNSCSEVIAAIALKVVASELKPLAEDLEPLVEFITDFKKLYTETNKFEEHVSQLEKTASEIEDLLSENEELSSDEELDDDDFSNNEKQIAGLSNDVLANELLLFAKGMDLDEDEPDSLSGDIVELFWKSKGIRNTYGASAEIRIRMKQVEKMARAKIVSSIFSASNDELAKELANYANA